jgi:hypothetical protein
MESRGFIISWTQYLLGGGENVNFREWYGLEEEGLSRGLPLQELRN